MTPSVIRRLVEISFALEPLLDKKDCTTRYYDLPNKPLYDFIISGVSTGEAFENYYQSLIDGNTQMFSHFREAIELSLFIRRKKVINVGLLEFMFISVKLRFLNENMCDVFEDLNDILKEEDADDIQNYILAFELARMSSTNELKKANQKRLKIESVKFNNLFELMLDAKSNAKDINSSAYQISSEYLNGFPIMRSFVDSVDEDKGLLKSIEDEYNRLHAEDPNIKVGVLADFAACAMFVYLSYQDLDNYVVK